MKLAFKLIFTLVVGVAVLLGLEAYVSVAREDEQFERDMAHELELLGRVLGVVVLDAWMDNGQDHAVELLKRADRAQQATTIRWIQFDAGPNATAPIATDAQLAPARSGQHASVVVVSDSGHRTLVAYEPVRIAGAYVGAVELTQPMTLAEQHERDTVQRAGFLTLSVALFGGGLIAVLGFLWVGRPLEQLIRKARRVAGGDLDTPVSLLTNDELQTLGDELNAMSSHLLEARDALREEAEARVNALEQLRHADRLTTVGTLAAGVAHELGTPLNIISGHASMVMGGSLSGDDILDSATTIKEQTARMTTIVERLLAFARRQPPKKQEVALDQVLEHTVGLLAPLAQKHGGTVQLGNVKRGLSIEADPGQLQQVLSNLIINGLQSKDTEVKVTVSADEALEQHDRPMVRIDVHDDGAGISQESIHRMFEPFYTTKAVGQGTGLGLSIAHGLVSEHAGWIEISSDLGSGSCFSVFLPKDSAP